ncbi:uncharacterized protein METZ01_LOCUS473221, partial [marine metagenome]
MLIEVGIHHPGIPLFEKACFHAGPDGQLLITQVCLVAQVLTRGFETAVEAGDAGIAAGHTKTQVPIGLYMGSLVHGATVHPALYSYLTLSIVDGPLTQAGI